MMRDGAKVTCIGVECRELALAPTSELHVNHVRITLGQIPKIWELSCRCHVTVMLLSNLRIHAVMQSAVKSQVGVSDNLPVDGRNEQPDTHYSQRFHKAHGSEATHPHQV